MFDKIHQLNDLVLVPLFVRKFLVTVSNVALQIVDRPSGGVCGRLDLESLDRQVWCLRQQVGLPSV